MPQTPKMKTNTELEAGNNCLTSLTTPAMDQIILHPLLLDKGLTRTCLMLLRIPVRSSTGWKSLFQEMNFRAGPFRRK